MGMHRDTSLGRYNLVIEADVIRLIATMVFEIFAFSVAGAMAFYFHKRNEMADKEGIVLEDTPGFRYTT
jgi:hypothetical protein